MEGTQKEIEVGCLFEEIRSSYTRYNKPLSLGPSSVQPAAAAVPYASLPAAAAGSSTSAPGARAPCMTDSGWPAECCRERECCPSQMTDPKNHFRRQLFVKEGT